MSSVSKRTHRSPRARAKWALAVLALMAGVGLSACGQANSVGDAVSSAPASFKPVAQDSSAPITVWVDSTRLPGVQAYQKAHPNVKLNIVTYNGDAEGSNYLQTKIELYTRAGSGWPDVVFSEEYNDAAWSTQPGID